MCDVAHAMLVEQLDGDSRAALAAGNDLMPDAARERLEERLDAPIQPPDGVDAEQWELRQALGVA